MPVHRGTKPRGELMVASYGRGRNGVLSIQRECHVLDFSQDIYAFDCNVTFGSSGAPVFAYDGRAPGNRVGRLVRGDTQRALGGLWHVASGSD